VSFRRTKILHGVCLLCALSRGLRGGQHVLQPELASGVRKERGPIKEEIELGSTVSISRNQDID